MADDQSTLLDALFAHAPIGLGFWDRDLRFRRVNATLAAINGLPVEAHPGHTLPELLGTFGAEAEESLRRVLASGEAIAGLELTGETPAAPGESRQWLATYFPVTGGPGEVVGVAAAIVEVSAQMRAEADRTRLLKEALTARAHAEAAQIRAEDALREAEAARARTEFLSEAGRRMAASMDFETTLQRVAEIAVPAIADSCEITVRQPDGHLRTIGAAQAEGSHGVESHASLDVPLRTPDGVIGSVTFAMGASGRSLGEADSALAVALAARAALHIRNAQLYTERSHIARTLQAGLLPETLPEIPGLELAARYQASGDENDVGGDFYDVFPSREGEWTALIGDVSGKGPEAAAITSLVRHTLRTAALRDDHPADNLRLLNRAMLADTRSTRFCTVVYARIRPVDDGIALTLATGGHPAPLVLRADGTLESAPVAGSLVGGTHEPVFADIELRLAPGDLMLLYTDGVTELRTHDPGFGDRVLAGTVRDHAGETADAIADAVLHSAIALQDGRPRDDIALLAMRAAPLALP